MAGEDVADGVGASEGLVDLHGRASGVGEYVGDAHALQGFHQDVRAFSGLVGAKSRSEGLWSGGLGFGGGEDIADLEMAVAEGSAIVGVEGNREDEFGMEFWGFE